VAIAGGAVTAPPRNPAILVKKGKSYYASVNNVVVVSSLSGHIR
jgi:hypothetical protein